MKAILTALGIALATVTGAQATSLDDAAKSTYILHSADDGFCSGTIIDKDKMITATHCTDNGRINIKQLVYDTKPDKGEFPLLREEVVYMKVLRTFKDEDVALLGTADGKPFPDSFGKPVDVASVVEVNKDLKLGTELWALGYPKIQELTLTSGMFTAKAALDIFGDGKGVFYKTTVPSAGGGSGGGLYMKFGDEYKLVGTTSAGQPSVSFMVYYSSIESVDKVLKGMVNLTPTETKTEKTTNKTLRTDEK